MSKAKTYSGNPPADGVLIASTVGFRLYRRGSAKAGWVGLKLIATGLLPKANWKLGCNGERMAQGDDWTVLCEQWPDVAEWTMQQSVMHCQDAKAEALP